jgi:hypothetical protein
VIRHLVLVRFAQATPPAERDAIFADLAALRAVLPGMRGFAAGANVSPEGRARGYTHAFTADFADAAARDAYLDHPAHKAAGARLVAALEGGREGSLILDFAVDEAPPG